MLKIQVDVSNYSKELKELIKYKLPFTSSKIRKVESVKDKIYIFIDTNNEKELENKIKAMIDKVVKNYIKYESTIIYESKFYSRVKNNNIYKDLIESGCIVEYEDGLIGFGKEFLQLYKYFDSIFLKWAKELGAEEYIYPDLIDIDTLNKCKYIQQFPNSVLFASHVKEDMERIEDFSSLISHREDCLNDYFLEKPKYVCKSAVCMHVYKQFENKEINLEKPLSITSIGKCKRYESLNMKKVERLLDFSMREIVLLGTEEFVLGKRKELIEKCKNLIDKLELEANIRSSNDPFFLSKYNPKTVFQKRFKLKYELNVILPQNRKELSVASFNYHNTYFSNAFNIQSRQGVPIHTSCIAFGLERFVYAYLSQKGMGECEITKRNSSWGKENV